MAALQPPDSQLCDVCNAIDFASYFQPPVEGEPSTRNRINMELFKSRTLGSGKELRQKSSFCTFCSLALNTPPRVDDNAIYSMSSIVCAKNRDEGDHTVQTAFYILITSDSRGVVSSVGHLQILAQDAHSLGLPREFLARVPDEAGFDMAQAREWLDRCRSDHGRLCDTLGGDAEQEPPPLQPSDLLAIDLVNMCICPMPQDSEYLALSYCWPAKAYLTLVQKNRAELFKQNALLDGMNALPGTVQDAIRCAQELPFRYLWIDALCIVQDDFKQKNAQLQQMDRVYGCASLTLVCAYPVPRGRDDPCSGFPGYNKGDESRRRMVRDVRDSTNWGGWELSRKPLGALSHMWVSYEMALSSYTHRDVSYPADILKAFEGIKAVLSDAFRTDFWQGMPEKILAQALCWQLRGPYKRRRNRPAGQPPSKPLFPSWTWAGWDSQVNLNTFMVTKVSRFDGEWFIVNEKSVATRLDVHPHWISSRSQRPSSSVIKPFLPRIVPREEVDANAEDWRDARVLACWTTRASFVLDGTVHQLGIPGHEQLWRESSNFAIKDAYGDTAGCILLPKDFLEDYGVTSMSCEFVLISRSHVVETNMSYFDESVYAKKDWCYLNVMMISRPLHLGEFEALRVGVGVVHQDAWVAAKPETEFVKLV
ncbi:heterokaryon incompatibility protein-domain-containing protein [Paraphoma chrysanthemicola]|uniref:Heterokaryon incompatibility protein-domain-containing protein n=1 Tax=Paraphoma chrysanthemicola TaxID=798071 RepID=A0A8K0R8C2_9PLEO|nr:heterokaryon incompatibility protein-domain-containing protein [Paraphoma chrysanthemicola]